MIDKPTRKEIRLKSYDYSSSGAYFVTICSHNREKVFWSEEKRNAYLRKTSINNLPALDFLPCLSEMGLTLKACIENVSRIYPAVKIDKYCIMPEHLHLIIYIHRESDQVDPVIPTLARIIKTLKEAVTKKSGKSIWQKSFYDHIIRNQDDYNNVWEYIDKNPLKYLSERVQL